MTRSGETHPFTRKKKKKSLKFPPGVGTGGFIGQELKMSLTCLPKQAEDYTSHEKVSPSEQNETKQNLVIKQAKSEIPDIGKKKKKTLLVESRMKRRKGRSDGAFLPASGKRNKGSKSSQFFWET